MDSGINTEPYKNKELTNKHVVVFPSKLAGDVGITVEEILKREPVMAGKRLSHVGGLCDATRGCWENYHKIVRLGYPRF